ncbi:MAG: cyclopropane-fatty-acyl-phospholipid synthase family protein [Candidatus Eremiobacteraeota bacterium]|nr:cyclopropane-fatty-acyl-phospholipid synthase family protein [Candidatus Eremiobacteraeota bacterium]
MPTTTTEKNITRIERSADGVEAAQEIVRRVFAGVHAGVAVALADGTVLREPDGALDATIILSEPSVLRALLTRTSDLGAGEAVVRGDLAVEGDVERGLVAMDAVAAARSPKDWIAIGALAAKLPRFVQRSSLARGRGPARLRGRVHSLERDRAAIAYHYDVSNEFYALWLDGNMTYSCAYFRTPTDSLDQAQLQKYDLICRKLRLREGERLLDVGCGWGGLVRFAAREYGVSAVGVTLSRKQAEYAQARVAEEGLERRCRIELLDYRELSALGPFDKAVSVGMVEHVGEANLATYFASVFDALKPGGLFLNHGIIAQQASATGVRALAKRFFPQRSRFTENYVFPDGQMPRFPPMAESAQRAGFELRDVENLREHYTLTLRHWIRRLEARASDARAIVGDATYNVWRFWLAGSAHSFDAGRLGVVQMLLAKWLPGGRAVLPMTRADVS